MRVIAAHRRTVGYRETKNFKLVLRKQRAEIGNENIALFRFWQCQKNYLRVCSDFLDNVTSLGPAIVILLRSLI